MGKPWHLGVEDWIRLRDSKDTEEKWFRIREVCLSTMIESMRVVAVIGAADCLEGEGTDEQRHAAWMDRVASLVTRAKYV